MMQSYKQECLSKSRRSTALSSIISGKNKVIPIDIGKSKQFGMPFKNNIGFFI